jgi:clan AA aspartic protease (TIGR02281 family)
MEKLGLGRRMSIRGAFIASLIALLFGIAWVGVASAQSSSLPPCGYVPFRDLDRVRCIGTYTWPGDQSYVGEMLAGKRNGQGTYTYDANGNKYVGEWRDGEKNGQGTHTYANGNKYVGEFQGGKFNGQGTFTWLSGNKYVGEWRDGKRNGQGTHTYTNGDKYVGEWRDGNPNGQGILTATDGRKYVGYWRDGRRNGQGKEYSSNGELVREGYWISGAYYGPNAPNGLRVENGERVRMVESGGIYHVPVVINNELKLDFVVDSGASDVCIPADVVLTLTRTGTIKSSDFIGTETYRLADGSAVSSRTFIIRSLKVGDRTVTDVRASIADVHGALLLGQSFLKRFKSWSQDNSAHELILE